MLKIQQVSGSGGLTSGARIVVESDEGATITITDGTTTRTGTIGESGYVTFEAVGAGEWTVTATIGEMSASDTITVAFEHYISLVPGYNITFYCGNYGSFTISGETGIESVTYYLAEGTSLRSYVPTVVVKSGYALIGWRDASGRIWSTDAVKAMTVSGDNTYTTVYSASY